MRNSTLVRLVASGWLLALVAGPALADGDFDPPPGGDGGQPITAFGSFYRYDIPDFELPPEARYTRSTIGRFSGDPQADVVTLLGRQPILLVNPEIWDAALPVPFVANDVASLPLRGTHGFDALVAVGPDGLAAITRRSEQGDYEIETLGGANSPWLGARRVLAADLDGAGGLDLLGLSEARDALVVMYANGATFDPPEVLAIDDTVFDLTPVDFDGTGTRIATVGEAGLSLFDLAGRLLERHSAFPRGILATIRGTAPNTQILVWATKRPDDVDMLVLLDGPRPPEAIPLGRINVTGMTTGDFDRDGDDDVVLAHQATHDLIVLRNRDGRFRTEGPSAVVIPTGIAGTATQSAASPVVGDLDGDTDLDLFFPIQSQKEAFVLQNSRVPDARLEPRLRQPVLFDLLPRINHPFLFDGHLQLQLRDAGMVPPQATHVEFVLWRKPTLTLPTEPAPLLGFRFPVQAGPLYDPGTLVLPAPQPSIFFWIQRYVQVEGGKRLRTFPAGTYAFTVEWEEEDPILVWLTEEVFGDVYSNTEGDPLLGGEGQTETVSTILIVKPLSDYAASTEPNDDLEF